MPIEIHEVEVLPPATTPTKTQAAGTPAPPPAEHGQQLRSWQRELAARVARLQAD
jgi:hypothetical protein